MLQIRFSQTIFIILFATSEATLLAIQLTYYISKQLLTQQKTITLSSVSAMRYTFQFITTDNKVNQDAHRRL